MTTLTERKNRIRASRSQRERAELAAKIHGKHRRSLLPWLLLIVVILIPVMLLLQSCTPRDEVYSCKVTTAQNVMESPSSSAVVDTIEPGEGVIVTGHQGNWLLVTTDKLVEGWIEGQCEEIAQ